VRSITFSNSLVEDEEKRALIFNAPLLSSDLMINVVFRHFKGKNKNLLRLKFKSVLKINQTSFILSYQENGGCNIHQIQVGVGFFGWVSG
jgi:hypothetical protein